MGRERNEEIVAPGGLKVYTDEGTTLVASLGSAAGVILADSAGNELLKGPTSPVSSAINEITITNGAANTAPSLVTTGGSTNVGITVSGKGTGTVTLGQATGSVTVVDGNNIVVGATTGTSFGAATSAKISFYGVTPITQPTSASQSAVTNTAPVTTGATCYGFGQQQATDIIAFCREVQRVLVLNGLMKGS